MSMTGGFSFFDKNYAAVYEGATIAASSNQADAKYVLSGDKAFRWQSVGSDDLQQETLIITLPFAISLDRLFLVKHNFKGYTIKYGANLNFTNVRSFEGAKDNISESGYNIDTSYYEFDAVTTDTIIITVDTAQAIDAEKYLAWFIATTEIGTFRGFPEIPPIGLDRNETKQKNATKGQRILKNKEKASLSINMRHYPKQADIDLMSDLQDRDNAFLVWPHGGVLTQFRLSVRGYRPSDVYLMQIVGPMKSGYYKNIYSLGADLKLKLEEVDR